VNKKTLEIGVSTGLVLLMIVLIMVVQMTFPIGLKSTGIALVVILFMVAMGFAGVKLIGIPER
jgi:hypothetical protein